MDAILVTEREAASLLSVSRPLVRQWVKTGRLPAVTIPPHEIVRIRLDDLRAFVEREAVPLVGPVRAPRPRKVVA